VGVAIVPHLRRPILEPPNRDPLPFAPRPSPGRQVGRLDIVGTAHFTRRSVEDAAAFASSHEYSSIAIELDRKRYDELDISAYSVPSPYRPLVEGEFVAAAEAFGNREGDIWLIDMSLAEIRDRISARLTPGEMRRWAWVSERLAPEEAAGVRFWEAGREEEAMRYLDLTTRAMREYAPTLYHVLIDERNLLMAARLREVAESTPSKTLVLVGKAHVMGISKLLQNPETISEGLEMNGLNYSPATRIRRARTS